MYIHILQKEYIFMCYIIGIAVAKFKHTSCAIDTDGIDLV